MLREQNLTRCDGVVEECSKVFNSSGSKMLSLSGQKARVLLQLLIPLVTWSVVNVTAEVKDFRLNSLDTRSNDSRLHVVEPPRRI